LHERGVDSVHLHEEEGQKAKDVVENKKFYYLTIIVSKNMSFGDNTGISSWTAKDPFRVKPKPKKTIPILINTANSLGSKGGFGGVVDTFGFKKSYRELVGVFGKSQNKMKSTKAQRQNVPGLGKQPPPYKKALTKKEQADLAKQFSKSLIVNEIEEMEDWPV
jgi:hypothetical protein